MTHHEPSPEEPALLDRIAELEAQLTDLDGRQKENQTSLFAAIKTMLSDIDEYQRGKRDLGSLRPAAHGLLFAYLRPKLVLVAGGLLAALLGIAQLWFLWNQQKLLEQQNILVAQQGRMLTEQTRANKVEAVSDLVLALDPRDSIRSHLAAIQLSNFGEYGFGPLLELSSDGGPISEIATSVLYSQGDIHSPAQIVEILASWAYESDAAWDPIRDMDDESPRQVILAAKYPITPVRRDHLRGYIMDISYRTERDGFFREELRSAILVRNGGVVSLFAHLYWMDIAACRELDLSWCQSGFGKPRAPGWHSAFYKLLLSLRTDVSVEKSRFAGGRVVYESMFSQSRTTDDVHRTILSWTVDGSPVDRSW